MFKKTGFLIIALLSLFPVFLVWLPFFLKIPRFWGIPIPEAGMATVVANYDGPLYIVIAKTLYSQTLIKQLFSFPLPTEYYAAHFPLYPLLIRIFSPMLGFPYSMLLVNLISSFLALYFFWLLAKRYVNEKEAFYLTAFFSVFPARWLVVRSVGSPEPLFIALIIASIYYFLQKKYLLAGVFGALAQFTKSPGILLFIAYIASVISPTLNTLVTADFKKWISKVEVRAFPVFLILAALIGVFSLYKLTFGNFLAYFHSGNNIHLMFPPFSIFNSTQAWVGTYWLEEIIFVYLIALLGLFKLIRDKENVLAWFVGIFLFSIAFVSHRDLVRYSLPIVPFLIIAYRGQILKREFKIAFVLLLLPIYLFALSFISGNAMPISDWAPLL